MHVCILSQSGEILVHRHMTTSPETFLKGMAPSRAGRVVAVEGLFTWYWLADRCAREGMPFVLGRALSMHAIHGGKAQNDPTDAHHMAVLLRGGLLPQAYVYPAAMRATRDLPRRRMQLMHERAELWAHLRKPHSQYTLPEVGKPLAYTANRDGVAERFPEPAVQNSIDVDLALLDSYDELPRDVELTSVKAATQHDAHPLYPLQTVPGIGKLLSLVLLYELDDINRFPRVQEFASYGRLVKGAKGSNGTRAGSPGAKIGKAHLKGAVSEAAVLSLRDHPAGQPRLARFEKKHCSS